MATIKDIAARLGVSISTVSKGLNGLQHKALQKGRKPQAGSVY